MKLIETPTSRRAVAQIAPRIIGRKLMVKDIDAHQKVEPDPVWRDILRFSNGGSRVIRRQFRPECMSCLRETGYRITAHHDGRVLEDRPNEFKPPVRLEQCKAELGNRVSTVEMETDDGARFSFAFVEGCRGGMGRIVYEDRRTKIFPVEQIEAEQGQIAPVVFDDPDIIPVRMELVFSHQDVSTGEGGPSTDILWQRSQTPELPVTDIRLMQKMIEGEYGVRFSSMVLSVEFPDTAHTHLLPGVPGKTAIEFALSKLDFPVREPFLWIDATDRGETTRYLIQNGFPSLLLDSAVVRPQAP
ncbi:MAG: hypothetical protein AABW86_02510 [Candidatus Micrarchaeota archaeon]